MQGNNTAFLLKTMQSLGSAKPACHHLLWKAAQGNIYIRTKPPLLILKNNLIAASKFIPNAIHSSSFATK